VHGRGFAYALYVHSKFPGYGAAWSAWIADVAVNKITGDVSVTRVVAGQDSGLMINPDGVRNQVEGAVAMGLGDNTRATLITRGLAEIARLGSALGAQNQTFAGLAGMGDLVATCSSPLSRNRTFGEYLGRGMTVAAASAAMNQTAEGVASSGPVLELARAHQVEMPITEVVEAVMRDGLPVTQAASMLASRSAKPEWYGP